MLATVSVAALACSRPSTCKHLVELDAHLQANLYLSAKAIAYWVKETFGVSYTESGMTAVLRRLGYVYKKHRLVPSKADRRSANVIPRLEPVVRCDDTHQR